MKPESLFRRRVRKWLEQELINCVIFSIQQMSINGDPDLILCLRGNFVALELKAENGKVSQLQKYKLDQIQWKGQGMAYVVDPSNWLEVQKDLLNLDKGESKSG